MMGRCYVQPVLAEGATIGHAGPSEIGNAADTLSNECVLKKHGIGGIAGSIGE